MELMAFAADNTHEQEEDLKTIALKVATMKKVKYLYFKIAARNFLFRLFTLAIFSSQKLLR